MVTRLQRHTSGNSESLGDKARRLRIAGEWASLAVLLDSAPSGERNSSAELRLLRAEAAIRLGDPHEAVDLSNAVLRENGLVDSSVRAKALLIRSSASRMRGFSEKALEDASAATAILDAHPAETELLIECHKQVGILLGMEGSLDKAIEHLERAHRLCANSPNLELLGGVEENLGVALGRLGRLAEASVHFANAKAAYRKLGYTAELAWALDNIGRLHYSLGQYERSLGTLREALGLARDAKARRTEAMVLVNIGDTLLAMEQHEEALQSYQTALDCGEQALEPRLFCCANTGMGSVYLAREDFGNARLFLKQASYEAERLKLKHELGVATIYLGTLACAEGDYTKAAEDLERAVALLQETGSTAPLVKAYLYLGRVLLKTSKWARLNDTLAALSNLVRDLDLTWNLAQEGKTIPEVIEYAASKRIGGTFFKAVKEALEAKGKQPVLGAARLDVVNQESTYPRVEVHGLGRLEVLVDGRRVSDAEWESQKAKELFIYLLCHRDGKGREELLEVLWPEVSVGLSKNAFYNNVYRTRRALFRGSILVEQGRYLVNPEGKFWFDLADFQGLVRQAETHPRGSDGRASLLARAVKLYRGSFLEEFYAEWASTIRMETEAAYLRSLARLAGFHAGKGDYEEAMRLLEQLLAVDKTDEGANEQLIKIHIRTGDLAAAQRHYTFYKELLVKELGTQPSKAFAQLHQEATAAL